MTENQNDPIGQMQAAMKFFAEMQKPAQEAMKLFADTQMKFFADTQRPAQEAMKAFAELQKPALEGMKAFAELQNAAQQAMKAFAEMQNSAQEAMKAFTEMQKPAQEAMKLFTEMQKPAIQAMSFFADMQKPTLEAMKFFAEMQKRAQKEGYAPVQAWRSILAEAPTSEVEVGVSYERGVDTSPRGGSVRRQATCSSPPWQYEACWRLNRTFHVYGFVLIGTLLLGLPDPALANWWIVRASDKQCLVVDIEPTGKDKNVTKIGKEVYPTREEAEADVKRLCKQGSDLNVQNPEP